MLRTNRQYARLVDDHDTHSLRRMKASIIYIATGNLRAVQILPGHTKIENTVRYLGVDIEDTLKFAEVTRGRQKGGLGVVRGRLSELSATRFGCPVMGPSPDCQVDASHLDSCRPTVRLALDSW
jgi:hypothetical protein